MRIRMVSEGMAATENILAQGRKLADSLPNLKKCRSSAMLIQ